MRIEEVLESINRAIDEIRAIKGITTKGHFIATTNIRKSMGPYKQCYINIIYVNLDTNTNTNFVEGSYMERVLVDNVDTFIGVAEQYALTKFFIKCHEPNLWDSILIGEYGSK